MGVPGADATETTTGAPRLVAAGLLAAVALATLAAIALGPGGVGVASADHEPPETNFTFDPIDSEDHRPGAENIRSGTIGQAARDVDTDFETLLELRSVYYEGSWADCGPTKSEVFGVDRGSDNEPYEVDESFEDNVKRFSAGEDEFVTEFHDEDDWGTSTHLNSEDRIFALIECVDNPEEPGWYQIDVAAVTGRTADGEEVTYEDPSHYFWICDCEDEAEAREQLGPPPSEPDPSPTPTPGSDGDGDATATRGSGDAATDTSSAETGATQSEPTTEGTPDGTATGDDELAAGDGDPTTTPATERAATASPTPTPADWNEIRVVTPPQGDGPGFGPAAAILALLAVASLARRRGG